MKLGSRRFIYMGISYLLSPALHVGTEAGLRLQQALISSGIDFAQVSLGENQVKVQRKSPFPLEIVVVGRISQPQPFSRILALASNPNRALDSFSAEVGAILEAVESTWPAPNRQIVSCDATLRCLYPSTSEHAFVELWEKRLHQPQASLTKLERPVLGGGLRLVMPPQPGDAEPTRVELKIESYLGDTKKVFVETQFAWPQPRPLGTPLNPAERLRQVDEYICNQVHAFMMDA